MKDDYISSWSPRQCPACDSTDLLIDFYGLIEIGGSCDTCGTYWGFNADLSLDVRGVLDDTDRRRRRRVYR